jgi:hypothetical protein
MNETPNWVERFLSTIQAIRRERRMLDYQRDSALLPEGRAVERERLAAISGYHYWEGDRDADLHT